MPAAELLGSLLLPAAVAASHRPFSAVVAVTDCRPSALAIRKAKSRSRQMRGVLHRLRDESRRWLGVHVPRTLNRTADRLSHPHLLPSVLEEVRRARLEPIVLDVPASGWAAAREAAGLPADALG
jgi:hypothetical protein